MNIVRCPEGAQKVKRPGSTNTMTSDFRPEVEIWPFRACAMHPAIIKNSSFIVDEAVRQIPRSTERISSTYMNCNIKVDKSNCLNEVYAVYRVGQLK